VNVFLWAGTALIALELPLLAFALTAPRIDALVGLEAAGSIFTLALVLLAQGFERSAYTILGVVAAVLTFAGGMVFVRFFERELDT
jgi:multisubunit Na+/H+ antiporter MnhF subunit